MSLRLTARDATAAAPPSAQRPGVHVLHPGDVALAERGGGLETLLGSCIAVVLTDPRRTVGVMCHIVHSGPPKPSVQRSAAHADVAFARMFALLRGRGLDPAMCEAYVYGGGNMFPELFTGGHVGASNTCWAMDALASAGVKVVQHDTGGRAYRRLAWTVGSSAPVVTSVAV